MSWWGAAAGAGIGGLVAGPIGAAVGAAVGGAVDAIFESDELDDLQVELRYDDVPDGRQLFLIPEFSASSLAGFFCCVLDKDGDLVEGRRSYRDEDGDFFAVAWYDSDLEAAPLFIPSGALKVKAGKKTILRTLAVDGDGDFIGEASFRMEWPEQKKYAASFLLRPLIDLSLHVARADGTVSADEKMLVAKALIAGFELSTAEARDIRQALQDRPMASIPDSVKEVYFRLSQIDPHAVVELMADVAKSDGVVTHEEAESVKAIALELGLIPESWPKVADELGLASSEHALDSAYTALELSPGASLQDVKRAFRRLVRDYHPDTVATLPIGFQQYAQNRTVEVGRAYEVLVLYLSSENRS